MSDEKQCLLTLVNAGLKVITVINNWYIKDPGDGRFYISGMAIPRDADGISRNMNFTNCDFHHASHGIFENCQIDGRPIPDGKGCLRIYADSFNN
jgi:hypothetical protein